MDKQKDSLYLPYRMIIEKITDEAPGDIPPEIQGRTGR